MDGGGLIMVKERSNEGNVNTELTQHNDKVSTLCSSTFWQYLEEVLVTVERGEEKDATLKKIHS